MMKAKKVLALAIAAAMVVLLVPGKAYAGYKEETNRVNGPDDNVVNGGATYGTKATGGKGDEIGKKEVKIKVKATTEAQEKPVYAVAIDTTELKFTYQGGTDELIWNPDELKYERKTAGAPGAWQADNASVEVRNYSNVAISVEANIANDVPGVPGAIFTSDHNTGNPLNLASAAPTTATGTGTVQKGSIKVTVTGKPDAVTAFDFADAATLTLTVKDNRK